MKVVGLITEYNPFHNGHLYHIQKAKSLTHADFCIVAMSGDFVQRGAPALMDKYLRTQTALLCGADLILELPVCYALGSAEYFAMGAISLFDKLGVVDSICFGSECGDISILDKFADCFIHETPVFQHSLRSAIKNGDSYPAARKKAAIEALSASNPAFLTQQKEILEQPNNILGIEYIKALKKRNSRILPYTLTRKCADYHDTELHTDISSASAIRKHLNAIFLPSLKKVVPDASYQILHSFFQKRFPIVEDDFSMILYYRLLSEHLKGNLLQRYYDLSSDLSLRILNELSNFQTFSQFVSHTKTKQLTHSRISRSLFHVLLHLEKQSIESYRENDFIFYARVLGFQKNSSALLHAVKSHADIPLITKIANGKKSLCALGTQMLSQDIFASELYRQIQNTKFSIKLPNEYRYGVLF